MHKQIITWACFVLLGSMTIGCEADRYQMLYRQGEAKIAELTEKMALQDATIAALQESTSTSQAQMSNKLAAATAQNKKLIAALRDAEEKIRILAQASPHKLPQLLSLALQDLAEANPDVMTYDPVLGMVKFKSDLTFAPGSDVVSKDAATGLAKLAEILNKPVGRKYEARIVGHTDNVPIGKPSTRANHPTNWHLSVHRAIAVMKALKGAGVAPERMGVAGYGEYRPIADNAPKSGNQANRRVEIFLLAKPEGVVPKQPAVEAPADPPAALDKDGAGAPEPEPAPNK